MVYYPLPWACPSGAQDWPLETTSCPGCRFSLPPGPPGRVEKRKKRQTAIVSWPVVVDPSLRGASPAGVGRELVTVSNLPENLAEVRRRMAAAAVRSGRPADSVRLVAVTKYVGADEIRALVAAGCTDLGESRPQQLWDRAAELDDLPVRWHMIGHIQRNKVERTLPLVAMVHSLDSLRLAEAVDAAAARLIAPCRSCSK